MYAYMYVPAVLWSPLRAALSLTRAGDSSAGRSGLGLPLTLVFASSPVRSDLRKDGLDRTTLFTSGDPAAPATLNFFTASATLLVVELFGVCVCGAGKGGGGGGGGGGRRRIRISHTCLSCYPIMVM